MNRSLLLACTLAFGSVMVRPVVISQWEVRAAGASRIDLEEAYCPAHQSTVPESTLPDSIHLKILLVEFSDVRCALDDDRSKPKYTVDDFEALLGSEGVYVSPRAFSPDGEEVYGSMNDYFGAMSGGRLRVTALVVNRRRPDGVTPRWIRLPGTKAYYQKFVTHLSPFVADALRAARDSALDVTTSPDERVVIIYAGNLYLRGGGLNPHMHGHAYNMSELQGRPYTEEVGTATFARIGIHCHEFAHTIGVGHTSGSRADLMEAGTKNGTMPGNAPAPLNAIARVRLGWATCVDVDTPENCAVDISYSLRSPTVYRFKNGNGDEFYVENRRFDRTMRIGEEEVPDYNHARFFPAAWPHGAISMGLLVWRRNTTEDYKNPGYSREGLLYASGRYGQTTPEGIPSETDDAVPFPGTGGVTTLSPWSDPRNPYMREPDPSDPSHTRYNLYVPNTKGGTRGGFEVISQDNERGMFGVMFRVQHPPNPAARNRSTMRSATANNTQRKLFRESGGRVHMTFESGGEIFYNRSLDGGLSWEAARQISTGNGGNAAPCVTGAGRTILIVWQVQASGAGSYAIHLARSSDGGNAWSKPASLAQIHDCTPPGPVPAAGGSHDGHAIVLARCGTGISCWISSNEGISWSPGPAYPGSTSASGAPACALSRSVDETLLAHVACADGGVAGESRVLYNALDVTNGAWTGETILSDVLPPEYADSRRPSIAASEGDRIHPAAIHVAWDVRHAAGGSNRLVVHRIARHGVFSPSYSVLANNSLASPSVTSLGAETALLLCQREPGGELWRFRYAGGTWMGDSLSCAPVGFDPQTSTGSDSAVSLWSSFGQSESHLHTRPEEPLAAGTSSHWHAARSLLIAIPGRAGTLLVSFRQCSAIRAGRASTILRPFCDGMGDTALSMDAVLPQMRSPGFWLDSRTDSIQVDFSLSGRALEELFPSTGGSVGFRLVRERTNEVLGTFARVHASDIPETDGAFTRLTLPVARLHDAGVEDSCAIQLVLTGLAGQASPVSFGKFYSQGLLDGVRHCIGRFEEEPTAVAQPNAIPNDVRLYQNYPNPFNGSTTITFDLPLDGDAVLEVYNTLGQRVATPLAGMMNKGRHTATVDGSGLASGAYIYRLSFTSAGIHSPEREGDNGATTIVKRFVLLK